MSTDGASFLRDEAGLDLGRSYTVKGLGIDVIMSKRGDLVVRCEEVQDMKVWRSEATQEQDQISRHFFSRPSRKPTPLDLDEITDRPVVPSLIQYLLAHKFSNLPKETTTT